MLTCAILPGSLHSYKRYAVGTADTPEGPFTFVGTTEPTAASMQHTGGIGDYALFVDTDNDGAGYACDIHDSSMTHPLAFSSTRERTH